MSFHDRIDLPFEEDPPHSVDHVSALPEPIEPANALAALRAGLLAMDERRVMLKEAGDKFGLANGAADVRVVINDLSALERAAKGDLAELMPRVGRALPRLEVPGLGTVEVRGGSDRKGWESERLLSLLLQKAIVDENGEVEDLSPLVVIARVFEVLKDCLPVTESLQWRGGRADGSAPGLRKYGLDPDEFCDVTEKPRLASIPKRQEAQ